MGVFLTRRTVSSPTSVCNGDRGIVYDVEIDVALILDHAHGLEDIYITCLADNNRLLPNGLATIHTQASTVVTPILQTLEAVDKGRHELPGGAGAAVVAVSENTAHVL